MIHQRQFAAISSDTNPYVNANNLSNFVDCQGKRPPLEAGKDQIIRTTYRTNSNTLRCSSEVKNGGTAPANNLSSEQVVMSNVSVLKVDLIVPVSNLTARPVSGTNWAVVEAKSANADQLQEAIAVQLCVEVIATGLGDVYDKDREYFECGAPDKKKYGVDGAGVIRRAFTAFIPLTNTISRAQ